MVLPKSTAAACGLIFTNNAVLELVKQKHGKHKQRYETTQETINTFDKFPKKRNEGIILFDKKYEFLYSFLKKTGRRTETIRVPSKLKFRWEIYQGVMK